MINNPFMIGAWFNLFALIATIGVLGGILWLYRHSMGQKHSQEQLETEKLLKEVDKLEKTKEGVLYHIQWNLHSGDRDKASLLEGYFQELEVTIDHMKQYLIDTQINEKAGVESAFL